MLENKTYYITNHTGLRPAAIALGAAQPSRNGIDMDTSLMLAVMIALVSSMFAMYMGYKTIKLLMVENENLRADIELLTWMDTDDDLI